MRVDGFAHEVCSSHLDVKLIAGEQRHTIGHAGRIRRNEQRAARMFGDPRVAAAHHNAAPHLLCGLDVGGHGVAWTSYAVDASHIMNQRSGSTRQAQRERRSHVERESEGGWRRLDERVRDSLMGSVKVSL